MSQYDLVLVNILAPVIGNIAPQLAQTLVPQGRLIVSGIIEARRCDAQDPLLGAGLELIEQVMVDGWHLSSA